jgi:hypothetical protein
MNFNSTHVEQEGVSPIMQIRLANAGASDRVCSSFFPVQVRVVTAQSLHPENYLLKAEFSLPMKPIVG